MWKRRMSCGIAIVGLFALILDSKTAISGAQNAITLCTYSVIPAIFPFLILSGIITSRMIETNYKIRKPLSRIYDIPTGAEGIIATGILGGYPIGAQAVCQAWKGGQLTKEDAQRILAFSSYAGPSFLFGILGSAFTIPWIPWVLWGIQITSGIFVAKILAGKGASQGTQSPQKPITITESLKRSVATMGYICGWIVLFRVILAFLDKWFLWQLPESFQVAIYGLLELANGCCALERIGNEGTRFILCSGMLAFGGLCVTMQTATVIEDLGASHYLKGKILQSLFSILLAMPVQYYLFTPTQRISISPIIPLALLICALLLPYICTKCKNRGSIPEIIRV